MAKTLRAMKRRPPTAAAAPGPPGPPIITDSPVPVCAICEQLMVELTCLETAALRMKVAHVAGGCGKGARPGETHRHFYCQSPHLSVPITVTYRVRMGEPGPADAA